MEKKMENEMETLGPFKGVYMECSRVTESPCRSLSVSLGRHGISFGTFRDSFKTWEGEKDERERERDICACIYMYIYIYIYICVCIYIYIHA